MAESLELKPAISIHEVLPKEIMVFILKKLGFTSIKVAKGTCKLWKKIIEDFNLVQNASRKFRYICDQLIRHHVIP